MDIPDLNRIPIDPKPIVTPGLRKQKDNQLRGASRPVKKPTTHLHP